MPNRCATPTDDGVLDLAIELWTQWAWANGLQEADPDFYREYWIRQAQAKVFPEVVCKARAA